MRNRHASSFRPLSGLPEDVRQGLRRLWRSPGFTAAAVLTLTIGIGATTAFFSLLDAALLRRLPFAHPEQLVSVIVTTRAGGWQSNVPGALFDELRRAPKSFSGVFAFWAGTSDFRVGDEVERAMIQHVSGDYYSTLGVRAAVGRLIDRSDDTPSGGSVAVLGYEFWRRSFAADPAIVGKTLTVEVTPRMIVGVTPRWFFGTDRSESPEITIPLSGIPQACKLLDHGPPQARGGPGAGTGGGDVRVAFRPRESPAGLSAVSERDRDELLSRA